MFASRTPRFGLIASALIASAWLAFGCASGSSSQCEGTACASDGAGAAGSPASSPSGSGGASASNGGSGGSAGTAVPPAAGSGSGSGSSGTGATGAAGAAGVPAAGTGAGAGAGTGGAAGVAGSAGGAAGSAAAAALQTPVVCGDRCVLALGPVVMEIVPAQGGRVTSLRFDQRELLTGPSVNAINYGSTFWTSPQADWSWPPIAAIDSAAFTVTAAAETECVLQGMKVVDGAHPNVDGVSIEKRFGADVAAQALVVQYTILNQSSSARRLAPWEITRVAPRGLTFYASDSAPSGDRKPATMTAAGCVWLDHDASIPLDSKLFGDGKGWLAHVSPDGVLLLKVFEDVAPNAAASGEAEVELYTGAGYDEIENQGSYAEIQPGAKRDWTVRWYLRALPASVARTAGNPELVAFVEGLL